MEDGRARFVSLIRRFAANAETAEELEELGVILIQQTIFWERRLGWKAADESSHAEIIYRQVENNKGRLAEVENPWGMLQTLIHHKLVDLRISDNRWQLRKVESHGRDEDAASDAALDDRLFGADQSLGPAETASSSDDWIRLEALLERYGNEEHVVYFRHWALGWKVVEIARLFQVTQNKVQLAVMRTQQYVLKATLQEERQKVDKILRTYPDPKHLEFFRGWLSGRDVPAMAKAAGLLNREVQSAIAVVVKYLSSRLNI